MTPTPDEVVKGLLKLRDFKKALEAKHKEELAPVEQKLRVLENHLLGVLNDQNAENMRTKFGTFYRNTKVSVSVNDPGGFREWVIEQGAWNIADVRANKVGVQAYVSLNGEAPPGVNYSEFAAVGVRSANGAHIDQPKKED